MSHSIAQKDKRKSRASPLRAETKSPSSRKSRRFYLAGAVVAAATFLCFANSLANEFVFDDRYIIVENRLLRSVHNIPKLLTASYRPIRDISHVLDFALWGENPSGFHLTNILIHILNTILVLSLINRLTRSLSTAILAALIFALHPIQTDAVTYLSGRRDLLFSLFYLAAFHQYLNYHRRRSYTSLGLFIIFWGLSLGSKEMAATLPLFIFVWNFCDVWNEGRATWLRRTLTAIREAFARDKWLYIILSAAALAYASYMIFVKGGSTRARAEGFEYWGGSFLTNALTAICVHGWYLKQLVYPTPIIQYKGAFHVASSFFDWRVILSMIFVGSVFATGLGMLRRDKLMAFAILSYFVLLLPVSQIIPHHELLADHYLYLPMMSFGFFVALVVEKISYRGEQFKKAAYAVAGILIVAMGVMTALRNRDWKDELTVWKVNYREVPNSIRAAYSLAQAYSTINPGKAEELYKRCIEIDPTYGSAYYFLAVLGKSREKALEIERIIRGGLSLPESGMKADEAIKFRSQLMTALALAKSNQGAAGEAEQLFLEAINTYPLNPLPYTLLANYYRSRDRDKAIAILEKLVAAFPGYVEPLSQLATLHISYKQYDEAVPYLEHVTQLVPNDFYANYQLCKIYGAKQLCGKARSYLAAAQSAAYKPEEIRDAQKAALDLEQSCGR